MNSLIDAFEILEIVRSAVGPTYAQLGALGPEGITIPSNQRRVLGNGIGEKSQRRCKESKSNKSLNGGHSTSRKRVQMQVSVG
jgi:hypothetical protein